MIVEWKHICPQKSLIFPAVMNQLGRKWWLSELQEPELKRKKRTELEHTSQQDFHDGRRLCPNSREADHDWLIDTQLHGSPIHTRLFCAQKN